MFEYEMWLNAAREKCRDLRIGTVFVLKDLFLGVEWDTLSGGEKRELGRRFKNCVLRDLSRELSQRESLWIREILGVWALPEAFCNTNAKLAIKQNDK